MSTAEPSGLGSLQREALQVLGNGVSETGATLRDRAEVDSTGALDTASETLRETALELRELESQGVQLGESVAAVNQLAIELGTTAYLLHRDPSGAAEALVRSADLVRSMSAAGDQLLDNPFEAATQSFEAAASFLRARDDQVLETLNLLLVDVTSRGEGELVETAFQILAIDHPVLRSVFELGDPDVIRGLQFFIDEPTAAREIASAITADIWLEAMTLGFVDSVIAAGTGLVTGGSIIAIVALFETSWSDVCPSVCSKRNCSVPGRFKAVPSNVSVDLWDDVIDTAEALDTISDIDFIIDPSLTGRIQPSWMVKAILSQFKDRVPLDIYLECEYEHCEDTPCWPFGGENLEWVCCRSAWLRVVNPSRGMDGSWLPGVRSTPPAGLIAAIERTMAQCRGCSF